jgi:hypothetical protein
MERAARTLDASYDDLKLELAKEICTADGQTWEAAGDPIHSLSGADEREHYLGVADTALSFLIEKGVIPGKHAASAPSPKR